MHGAMQHGSLVIATLAITSTARAGGMAAPRANQSSVIADDFCVSGMVA